MTEPQDRAISCFRNAAQSRWPVAERNMMVVYDAIRGSESLRERIETLRAHPDGEARDEWKRTQLPAVTPSALYRQGQRRQERGGFRHSGAIVLDVDHVADVDGLRSAAADVADANGYPYAVAVFRSPSGDGLKIIVHVGPLPADQEQHAAAWAAAARLYGDELGVECDPTGSDVSRLCFLSHDPELVLRPARATRALLWRARR